MRTSTIILTALAATTIAISAPAEAKLHHAAQRYSQPIDAAAVPAYPVEHQAKTAHARRHAAPRRVARTTTTYRADDEDSQAERPAAGARGTGVVRSGKTGFAVHVSAQYSGRFQAFIDDLEARGATVYYMGGIRPGRCSLASQHPCGWALDVCQDRRGHVSGARDCNLPRPAEFHAIARAHGLYEGSVWCSGDYGHVQAKDSGGCNVAAHGRWGHGHVRLASMTGSIQFVARHYLRHHHRLRYARR